jgi:hypothetical protein
MKERADNKDLLAERTGKSRVISFPIFVVADRISLDCPIGHSRSSEG